MRMWSERVPYVPPNVNPNPNPNRNPNPNGNPNPIPNPINPNPNPKGGIYGTLTAPLYYLFNVYHWVCGQVVVEVGYRGS